MNAVAPFNEEDKAADLAAFSTLPSVIPMLFGEIHVIRSFFVYLTMIAQLIVFYPIQLIKGLGKLQDPQYKYGLCIFVSIFLSSIVPYFLGYDAEDALDFVRTQKFYKIWAIYTLFYIIQKFLAKVHVHTHKMIRGAIREGKSVIVPTIIHSISNFLFLFTYNVFSATYLAGLYGKAGLFISAALHVEAVIAKKYLPKVLDFLPQFTMPIERLVLLFSIGLHLSMGGSFQQVVPLIALQYTFVFIKMFLVAISEDSTLTYQSLKLGADNAFYQFCHNDAKFEDSIIANVPLESFALSTIFLLVKGPLINTLIIAGIVVSISLIGNPVIKALCPTIKPILPVIGKKKDKKKDKDQKKDDKKDGKDDKDDKNKDEKKKKE